MQPLPHPDVSTTHWDRSQLSSLCAPQTWPVCRTSGQREARGEQGAGTGRRQLPSLCSRQPGVAAAVALVRETAGLGQQRVLQDGKQHPAGRALRWGPVTWVWGKPGAPPPMQGFSRVGPAGRFHSFIHSFDLNQELLSSRQALEQGLGQRRPQGHRPSGLRARERGCHPETSPGGEENPGGTQAETGPQAPDN